MEEHWLALGSWFIGSCAFAGHFLIVFYAKDFVWDDLVPKVATEEFATYYHQNPAVRFKFLVCGVAMAICRCGVVSMFQGQLLTIMLAIPQLYRAKGERSQQLRVILGPLTPILALNNLLRSCCITSVAQFIMCFLAFVVLRPDNTSVLDLCLTVRWFEALQPYLSEYKIQRRLHGSLAACNAALCLFSLVRTSSAVHHHFSWE